MTERSNQTMDRAAVVSMTLLGVDWGERRIGLAIKPAGQDWSLPSTVVQVTDEREAMQALARRVSEYAVQGVVVGLPVDPGGQMARRVRRFCRKARTLTPGVRWFFVDETLTSQAAEAISLTSVRQRPADDLAAMLILESFLRQWD